MNRHFLMTLQNLSEKILHRHFLTGFYWFENSIMIWNKLMAEKEFEYTREWFWDYLGFSPLNVEE